MFELASQSEVRTLSKSLEGSHTGTRENFLDFFFERSFIMERELPPAASVSEV